MSAEKKLLHTMKTPSLILLMLLAAACSTKKPFDASKLAVEWELVNGNDEKGNFSAALTFTNNSESELPPDDWKIFFSLRYHTTDLKSNEATIEHINGELFTISGFT